MHHVRHLHLLLSHSERAGPYNSVREITSHCRAKSVMNKRIMGEMNVLALTTSDCQSAEGHICRQEGLPGWRAGADLALTKPESAISPPAPGTYHLTDLIQSIESRLRESAVGDSQHITPQTEDGDSNNDPGHVDAPADLDRSEGGFVSVSHALDEEGTYSSSPDSRSSIGSQTLQLPSTSRPTGNRTASPAGSHNRQEQEVVVVLSMDNERQNQLEDAAALWQVDLAFSLANLSLN